ncbi:MAG: hypothetical protein ACRBB3_03655 [Alphaproteobacteria bacterium]
MPRDDSHKSEIHKKKSKKNYAVLAIIFGFVALIWVISIIKMSV